MPLIACGINHKTASLSKREQLIILPADMPHVLSDLLKAGAANEAFILSTCNRTEIYLYTPIISTHHHSCDSMDTIAGDFKHLSHLIAWLNAHPRMRGVAHAEDWYWHQDYDAVKHMMRVASGLDSMVLGEPQILGQMKQAFAWAQENGAVGKQLKPLFQKIFSVTKQVRTQTHVGANPVSVAYIAVSLAKRIFSDLSKMQVLLVGAGQTIELAALHLSDCGVKNFVFANRSFSKAVRLAEQFQGKAISLSDLAFYLSSSNMVVSATSSAFPIFGKGMVESALKSGKRRALLMLDLAVPRDIESEVAQLEDVYLYNMDHLQAIAKDNMKSRLDAAEQAEAIIDIQARYYIKQREAIDVSQTILAYRDKLDTLRQESVDAALHQLMLGQDPALVVTEMARKLTQKILHSPSVRLREAAVDHQVELLLAARKLLDL